MLWLLLALLAALSAATKDLVSKKGLQKMNEYTMAWGLRGFTVPFVIPLLLIAPIPQVNMMFVWALLVAATLNVFTTIMYMKAIKLSPLSITVPMIAFTPLFMIITSPLILGEFPSAMGIIGIILIVTGAYFIHVREVRRGPLEPFRKLVKEQGPLWMLGVAFIWSIGANIDKIGVLNSNPMFWIISTNVLIAVLLTPIAYIKTKGRFGNKSSNVKALLPLGLFSALMLIFQMSALPLTLAAYVISIKRLGAIFAIIYGFIFFREKNIKQALLGTCIMLVGVLFITLL